MNNKIKKADHAEEQKAVEALEAPEVTTTEQEAPVNFNLLVDRISELEKQLSEKQHKSIDEAISFYREKQRKIAELESFKLNKKEIEEALNLVNEKVRARDFEAKVYRLSVSQYRDYDREGQKVFSLTNPLILAECMQFILVKIADRVDELQKEIEQ